MKKVIFIAFFIQIWLYSEAQIVFDLSDKNESTESVDFKIGSQVLFKNLIPSERISGHYSFIIDVKQEPIPAFKGAQLAGAECEKSVEVQNEIASINNEEDEGKIPDHIKNLNEIINKPPKDINNNCLRYLKSLIELTKYIMPLQFKLDYNQTITITVKRKGKDSTYIWTKIYKTPIKSPWHIMYGFTFVPDMLNPVTNYYCKADTTGKLYTVTKLNNQRNDFFKNISPTLMFQWSPMKKYYFRTGSISKAFFSNNFYQLGFVGGLSLNFTSEIGTINVLAGPSIVIADNISLCTGIILTQKNILNGQYKEGDIIKENLDFDQLHEKKYMAECFISLAIRFDSNPFKKDESK